MRAVAELGGGGLGGGGVEVADRDDDALAGERAGERLADAAGAAGDDGDLAGQRAGCLGHGVNYGESSSERGYRSSETVAAHRKAPLGR